MRDQLLHITLIAKDVGILLWLNGIQEAYHRSSIYNYRRLPRHMFFVCWREQYVVESVIYYHANKYNCDTLLSFRWVQ